MNQRTIFDAIEARARGTTAADACLEKAERTTQVDRERVAAAMLERLAAGDATGEQLTDAALAAGLEPHDTRAFGAVVARLAREGRIVCVGFGTRKRGHGTAGARVWRRAS